MKRIITDEKKLSVRSDEVDVRKENKVIQNIVLQLKEVVRAKNLASLSAIQIGHAKRLFVIRFGDKDIRTFINPVITKVKGFELSREKCSSIPDKEFIRPRHNVVDVTYMTPLGKIESRQFVGMAAIVVQQNIDLLDGLLLSDIGLEVTEEFDKADDAEREELISAYLDSLDIRKKEIDTEIENTAELKQVSDAIKFLNGVATGEVKLGEPFILEKTGDTPC